MKFAIICILIFLSVAACAMDGHGWIRLTQDGKELYYEGLRDGANFYQLTVLRVRMISAELALWIWGSNFIPAIDAFYDQGEKVLDVPVTYVVAWIEEDAAKESE